MKKFYFLTLLFLCFLNTFDANANTGKLHWCGVYFEQNEQAYLRLAKEDVFKGSNNCIIEEYHSRVNQTGYIDVALDFTIQKNKRNNWNKFNNRVIEVRGKLRDGKITNTNFIQDRGI